MSKSLLYAVNTASQTMAANGIVSFGNIVRRYGNNVDVSNGNPIVSGIGYYSIDANVTISASATGGITLTLYKDGVAIPGAKQSFTIETANDLVGFSIPAVIKQNCCMDSTITAVISGAGSVSNASIVVEKV